MNAAQQAILKTEVTTDPLARGYSGMSDLAVAVAMNALDRPMEREPGALMRYLLTNRFRSNDGADTTPTMIYGRIADVRDSAAGGDPFGRALGTLTLEQRHAAYAVLALAEASTVEVIDFSDTEFNTALSALALGANGCRAMGTPDVNAIKALGDNLISRAGELGLPRVREGHVIAARAA